MNGTAVIDQLNRGCTGHPDEPRDAGAMAAHVGRADPQAGHIVVRASAERRQNLKG
jgi:hypothetical protein